MEFSGTLSRVNAAVETVTYRGNQDFHGDDTVSLTIDDEGQHGSGGALTTTESFDVTVNPVNDLPTLDEINDFTIDEDATEQTVNLTGITAGGGESQSMRVHASNSLISRYDLDGDGLDSSGFSKHSVAGIATPTDNRHSDSDTALAFNGTTDELAFDYQFPFNDDADRSLSFWMKAPADGHSAVFWGRENDTNQHRFHIYLNLTSATLGVDYSASNGTHHDLFAPSRGNLAPFTPDQWVFVALTREANSYSLSIDGTLVSTATDESPDLPSGTGWEMAGRGGNHFNGSLDDVRFYDRALTSNEVTAIYNDNLTSFSPRVTYDGTSTVGQIAFEPVTNEFGVSTTVVTIEDGGLDDDLDTVDDNATFSRSFVLTVNPVNDLPTLDEINDVTIDEDATEQTVDLAGITAGGSESQALRVSVLVSSPGTFADDTPASAGSRPFSMAIGDFDENGDQDLVVVESNDDTVSLLLGNGDGEFAAATPFSVGVAPTSVAVGDFDGDGHQDLVVTNEDDDTVSILLGTGNGSFGTPTGFPVGSDPKAVVVGEFNGDDHLDLAVVNHGDTVFVDDDVSVLLNAGDGSFGAATSYAVGDRPHDLSIGDFNGDGLQDLAVANRGAGPSPDSRVSILLGSGDGTFGAETRFDTDATDPRSVTVGDFDGDGYQDLAVVDASGQGELLSILPGAGDGSFGSPAQFATDDQSFSVAVGDFNGDGDMDLAVANVGSDNVSVLSGEGDGTFGAASHLLVGDAPTSIVVGDLNNDGIQDLATSNSNSDDVSVLLGHAGIIPPSTVGYTTPNSTGSLAFTPAADQHGTETITVTVEDGGLDNDLDSVADNALFSRSFEVTVSPVNDAPVAVADSFSTNEDEQVVIAAATGVLGNDSDIEDDPLTAVLVSDVANGTLSLGSDGGLTYTPAPGFHGAESFTYKANDGADDGNTVTVAIDVVQKPEIQGTLFHDLDGNGAFDAGEPGLAGWTVFLDTSDDGILDAGEVSTTTLSDGRGDYSFVDLTPGDYTVAWITPSGWQATASSQSVTLVAGDVQEDVDLFDQFIVSATPSISSSPFADDDSADTITIGPNGTDIEVTVNGNVIIRKPANQLTSITIDGSGDDDTLIVDLGGLDAALGFAADLTFNGNGDGSDNDTLEIQNGSAANIAYSFTNASDGAIEIDSGTVTYTGLEPIIDSLTADHREFTFATTDDVVTLADDGTSDNGLLTLSSVSSSETVTFANPSTSMGIHLGDGADQLTVVSLDDGFAGSLILNGEGGDDTIDASAIDVAIKQNGSGGNDTLTGGSANDTLNGGSGEDLLVGGPGNDKLQGQGTSYDTLTGGPGDDTLDGGDGYDRISESADVDFTATDSSLTGLGTDTLINIQLVQLFGGSTANTIDASAFSGRAFLNGSGGNDTLTGGGWYDRIFGGSGRDLITGGTSVVDSGTGLPTYDVLRGQGGNNDTLIGGDGADKLNGGIGHDSLVGAGGDDVLTGDSGNDTIDGGAGDDRLYERSNVDMTLTDAALSGGLGSDNLTSIETAYLKGGNSDNRLDASAFSGDVTLIGVGGADTLKGGSGNDMINGRSGADSITGGDGDDTLQGMRDTDTLNGGAGDDWIDGGTQDDAISGWTGDDTLYGRSGNDILVGGDGHDALYGAAGDDILQGDDGKSGTDHTRDNDRLDGGTDADTVRGGGGSDTMMDDSAEVDENFAYWAEWVDAV